MAVTFSILKQSQRLERVDHPPAIIGIMMDNARAHWGEACYLVSQ